MSKPVQPATAAVNLLQGGHGAFDRGAVSEFYRSTVTLGQLKTAMLCIDGKKTGTWKPEQLEIIDIKLNKVMPNTAPLNGCRRS